MELQLYLFRISWQAPPQISGPLRLMGAYAAQEVVVPAELLQAGLQP